MRKRGKFAAIILPEFPATRLTQICFFFVYMHVHPAPSFQRPIKRAAGRSGNGLLTFILNHICAARLIGRNEHLSDDL